MDKEKFRKLELYNLPNFNFLDAYTGPDILNPTHQLVKTTIKLKRSSVEAMIQNHDETLTLTFSDQYGIDMEIPVLEMGFIEIPNTSLVSVTITGLFPINEMYRIEPPKGPIEPMGY